MPFYALMERGEGLFLTLSDALERCCWSVKGWGGLRLISGRLGFLPIKVGRPSLDKGRQAFT